VKLGDIFFLAFKALKDRKLRTSLTILGIVIGAAMVVALVASTSGLSASVTAQVSKMGVSTLTVFPTSGKVQITDADVAVVAALDGVKDVIPYYQRRLSINYGSTSLSIVLYGLDQSKLFTLYKGLGLDDGDLVDVYDPTGIVIGASIANPPEGSLPSYGVNELLPLVGPSSGRGAPPGYALLVRGILKPFGAVGFNDIDNTVFMSQTGAQLVFKFSSYSGLYVIANSNDDVPTATAGITDYFGTNARIMSAASLLATVQSITGQLTLFLGGVAVVSLFVAGVGITNTMFVSVMERTREIGIMKAIGYRPKDILLMFLAEAATSGMIGGIIGTVTGIALSFLLGGALPMSNVRFGPATRSATSSGFTPVISSDLLVFSLIFPIVISIIAGLYPAWRGSRLNTVLALKYE
jgi:putative ABC transport system permease protein